MIDPELVRRLTESGRPPPADYHASFTELVPLGVLEPEFARRVAACAGLRNRIVHESNGLDPARVHEALQLALEDVPAYLRRVEAHVGRVAGSPRGTARGRDAP